VCSVCDVHGASQFLLELEFISLTLDYYLTDAAQAAFDLAKEALTQRLTSEAAELAAGATARQALLQAAGDSRTHALQQMQQATACMFSCFTSTQVRRKKAGGK
jgi:hypothetical protein